MTAPTLPKSRATPRVRRLWLLASFFGILVSFLAGPLALISPEALAASPRGAVLTPGALSRGDRRELVRAVARARRRSPEAFAALRTLRSALPRIARGQRGRYVTVIRPLRSLGTEGLMPMLGELALSAAPAGSLSPRAWLGWRLSLIEAVGSLRDPRAVPVLWAVLKERDTAEPLSRTAARALARMSSDGVAAQLIAAMGDGDPRLRRAILPVLGECRRLVVAQKLADTLRAAPKESWEEGAAITALGDAGNSWAWTTPPVKASGEGDQVKRAAAEALIRRYPRLSTARRRQAFKSLVLVDCPRTPELIAAAIRQDPRGEAALHTLAAELDRALKRMP